jgi:hypothetical protein
VSETSRVLLTAVILAASTFIAFAWRVARIEADQPERLVGELRLSQWAALLLAAVGAAGLGLAAARSLVPLGTIDVTLGVAAIALGAFVMLREPRSGLLLAGTGLLLHALTDLAHRPGLLSPEVMPRWYVVGCAAWNVVLAGTCFWVRRRPA